MSPAASTRLPLQIGTSTLWSLARASVLGGLGGGALLVGYGWMSGSEVVSTAGLVFALVVGLGLISTAAPELARARRSRPSDVELSSAGLKLVGGPCDGLAHVDGIVTDPE